MTPQRPRDNRQRPQQRNAQSRSGQGRDRGDEGNQEKAPSRPLLQRVAQLVKDHEGQCHPGLWLDRFAQPRDQENQKCEIDAVIKCGGALSAEEYKQALQRRQDTLSAVAAQTFTATTTGPFTLHLARAAALENAGLCLHPVYGFPCIPGSGLKGMAHAFATEVWLPTQDDKQAAWTTICRVFGWVPSPWLKALAKRHEVKVPEKESTGAIVFHEAWPEKPPRLFCDIVNSHHPDYYGSKEDQVPPPGDWEDPKPVYFLAVAPDTAFDFPLSPRQSSATSQDDLTLAAQWLMGALVHRGAGAKTNAGYGRFQIKTTPIVLEEAHSQATHAWNSHREANHLSEESYALEIVTPAFLAGAQQSIEDCDLRPATLRGQLRWWWRTMHAHALPPAMLRKQENTLWGDTKESGLVSVVLHAEKKMPPEQFSQRPNSGYYFIAYGMDENPKEDKRKRYYLCEGTSWTLTLQTRGGKHGEKPITSQQALDQACAALALLCRYGGVGARCRKGFGSLMLPDSLAALDADACLKSADSFRKALALRDADPGQPSIGRYALVDRIELEPRIVSGRDIGACLERLGMKYKEWAKEHKDEADLVILGRPRHAHDIKRRYASPVHFHFDKADNQVNQNPQYTVRMIAFPTDMGEPAFSDTNRDRYMLDAQSAASAIESLKATLEKQFNRTARPVHKATPPTAQPAKPVPPSTPTPPPDPLAEFQDWFHDQGFSKANKGRHNQIVEEIEKRFSGSETLRNDARQFVASKL